MRSRTRWLVVAGIAMLGLLAFRVLIPDLVPSTVTSNESITIGEVATIRSAQRVYANENGGYFDNLECLSNPYDCIPGYTTDQPYFIGDDLATADVRYGYQRIFYPGPGTDLSEDARTRCSPSSLVSFAYLAVPEEPGESGVRSFCADSTGRLCEFPEGEVPDIRDGLCPEGCRQIR